jgi:hypothetical protein
MLLSAFLMGGSIPCGRGGGSGTTPKRRMAKALLPPIENSDKQHKNKSIDRLFESGIATRVRQF